MHIVVAVDKFKGSLTTFEACKQIKCAIKLVKSNYTISTYPMADGGDGFAKVLKHYLKTKTINVVTVDPINRKLRGYYEWNSTTKTAIIELAVASGIALLKEYERNPMLTSSIGTGFLIKHAINKGAKKIILGLGGSATNDGGMGIAYALGFKFKNAQGDDLLPIGSSLNQIRQIQKPVQHKKINFTIACDVTNPLYGKNGASYIYGPQKGANQEEVVLLDKGLKNLSKIIFNDTGKDVANITGVGAAGGVAAILNGYFNVTMIKGIDLIIKHSAIINGLKNADLLITGEGKVDEQSLSGKVVGKLIQLSNQISIPIILVAGVNELTNNAELHDIPVLQLMDYKISLNESMINAGKFLHLRINDYFKSIV